MECGIMLAKCAIRGCALNIDANLPMIKNREKNEELARESEALKALAGI
jgi:formiminotetrahydrofolate cyclodeaminase